jgi:hypothetical protein
MVAKGLCPSEATLHHILESKLLRADRSDAIVTKRARTYADAPFPVDASTLGVSTSVPGGHFPSRATDVLSLARLKAFKARHRDPSMFRWPDSRRGLAHSPLAVPARLRRVPPRVGNGDRRTSRRSKRPVLPTPGRHIRFRRALEHRLELKHRSNATRCMNSRS